MNGRRALASLVLPLALLAAAIGPSCGGGPSGTARTTIEGNVAEVAHARLDVPAPGPAARLLALLRPLGEAWAQNGLEGIRVTLEGTEYSTETSGDGSFVLECEYVGAATLLFERANDALVARLPLDVPDGGKVTLRNVRCRRPSGSCQADAVEIEKPKARPAKAERDPKGPADPRSSDDPPRGPDHRGRDDRGKSDDGPPPHARNPRDPGENPQSGRGRPDPSSSRGRNGGD